MQISSSILSGYALDIQTSKSRNVEKPLRDMPDQDNVKALAENKKESRQFVLGPDIDTYRSSNIEVVSDLYEANRKYALEQWEKAGKTYGNGLFSRHGGEQHELFIQKLQESGFFDGMSEDEVNRYTSLLTDITATMNCVNLSGLATDGRYCPLPENRPDYDEALYHTFSDEARLELESATAALQYFSDKYLNAEQKEGFNSLISEFHDYNSEYLKDYQTIEEQFTRGVQTLQDSRAEGHMIRRVHTEEETESYRKNITDIFKKLQQSGSDTEKLWEQMKKEHLNYLTYGTDRQDHKNRAWKYAGGAFEHMKGYWSRLFED